MNENFTDGHLKLCYRQRFLDRPLFLKLVSSCNASNKRNGLKKANKTHVLTDMSIKVEVGTITKQ